MTRTRIREYTEAVRWRYLGSPKTEKSKILDEFTKVTGYHRKTAIRLLHQRISRGRVRSTDARVSTARR